MSALSQTEPRRFELTSTAGVYRVSIPNYLSDGERVKVREDRAVAADIEAVATFLGGLSGRVAAYQERDQAAALLAVVFSEVVDA